jgi:hypothetical protein
MLDQEGGERKESVILGLLLRCFEHSALTLGLLRTVPQTWLRPLTRPLQ